jgi:hypothetical protein
VNFHWTYLGTIELYIYWDQWNKYVTTPIEQSPSWESSSRSARQEHCIYENPKVLYRVQKSPIMNQLNAVHSLTSCFFKNHFNIIVLSKFSSLTWSCLHVFVYSFLRVEISDNLKCKLNFEDFSHSPSFLKYVGCLPNFVGYKPMYCSRDESVRFA